MKKLILAALALFFIGNVNAQSTKFFMNNTAATSANGDCATLQQLKISFPVPANVSSFDCYFINLNLSSLDVPAFIFFDKADIQSKLAGKKEYKAEIVKANGTSDFTFDDTSLTMRDLCFVPRLWQMSQLEIEVAGTGHKITGYHWEDQWDEDKAMWISDKVADWDDGVVYGSGTFTLKQQPLTDGIEDATGYLKVKPGGTTNTGFEEPVVAGALTTIGILDTSTGVPVQFIWSVFDAAEYSKDYLKSELIIAFNGKEKETDIGIVKERSGFFGAYMDAYQTWRDFEFKKKIAVKGKLADAFSQVTFAGNNYEHICFRQNWYFDHQTYEYRLKPGVYINCYIMQKGDRVILITAEASDMLTDYYQHVAFSGDDSESGKENEWFSARVTDQNLSSIDALVDKTVSATTYLQ